jgi:hypothetical protein
MRWTFVLLGVVAITLFVLGDPRRQRCDRNQRGAGGCSAKILPVST